MFGKVFGRDYIEKIKGRYNLLLMEFRILYIDKIHKVIELYRCKSATVSLALGWYSFSPFLNGLFLCL